MKILLYCRTLSLGKGGTERVVTELANEMANRKHKVYLAYRTLMGNDTPAYPTLPGVGLIPIHEGSANMLEFRTLITHISPDIFVGFYANPFVYESIYLTEGTNIPLVLQECSNPDRVINTNWIRNYENNSVALLEREVATAAAARIRLTLPEYKNSFPKYIQKNIRIFPNAFKSFIKSPHAQDNTKYILHIGGYKPNKNLLTLLRAFALLKDFYNEWKVLLFSHFPQDLDYLNECKNFVKLNKMEYNVLFNGSTDDIHAEYNRAKIHVITSLSEGLPNCVCEAMINGVPTIGYDDCYGTNSLIKHDFNGLLAPSTNRIEGLAASMRKLMEEDSYRERLGSNAKKDSHIFDPKQVYNSWEEMFYEAAEYKKDPKKLIYEQVSIDKNRSLLATRLRSEVTSKYISLSKMFS